MDTLACAQQVMHRMAAPEDVGALRRYVRALAISAGASSADSGRAELIATELGTNTLRHAQPPGYVLVQPLVAPQPAGLEIIAVDSGPGIRDLAGVLRGEAHLQWGARTDGSIVVQGLGCGLGSVRRLASEFDIHTALGRGTVVLARCLFEPVPSEGRALRWGAVSVPIPGEVENGDSWAVTFEPACTILLADGLGHGPAAACASQAAIAAAGQLQAPQIEPYFAASNAALRSTRGTAMSICRISQEEQRLWFAGVGNVEGRVYRGAESTGLAPRSGTLGVQLATPKIQVREMGWQPGDMLILHSDGVRHPFELGDVRSRDPSLIAAVLHRDLGRGRDDATVLVVRDMRSPS